MVPGLDPTEEYDGSITVRLLDDTAGSESVRCSSYERAIDVVRDNQHSVTVTKIVDRDGDVVFSSADTDIDDWEVEWRHEKQRLSVTVEERECPYDDRACFADDLCVRCKMDKVKQQY